MPSKTQKTTARKLKPAVSEAVDHYIGKGRGERTAEAKPPKDDPMLRHEELNKDRTIVGDDHDVAATRPANGKAALVESETRRTARRRLGLIEQVRPLKVAVGATPGTIGEGEGLMPAVPGISNWVQAGPMAIPKGQTYGGVRVLVTGRVTEIVIDPTAPNTVYAATAQGGVWKTTDGGLNWRPKSDNEVSLAIGAIAMDPSNHLVIYAATGEGNFSGDSYYGAGVLKSVNGGDSWTANATTTFAGTRFSRIAITPTTTNRLFGATGNGLYRSTDGGVNWAQLTNGLPSSYATDVVIDSTTPTTAYAAFWGQGIYKTTDAGGSNPAWTKLTSTLPTSGFTRIALGISPSSPQTLYALIANSSYTVDKLFVTTNGGSVWTAIPLPGGSIGGQGFYNLNVAVDPTTPDIIYLSGISLWKGVRNTMTNTWTFTDIGGKFHPDNHAFAFHPTNHQILYAGSDGGIYRSTDGGTTWDDSINKQLCITQFEFIDQHPTSDAVLFGGTQDNGTEQFRNSPVFYHADDGDGGFVCVDQTPAGNGNNVLSTYYGNSPKRSTLGGKFSSWTGVSGGIGGSGLFYPPMTMDQTNSNNVAFGTDRINLTSTQGTGGWTQVTLPGLSTGEVVSAICYTNSTLIYAGTTHGKVFRLVKTGTTWNATAIQQSPLPSGWIWDVSSLPGSTNTVIVVMSGFGISHVWRGTVPSTGAATWTNISGTGPVLTSTTPGTLPDIPVNALAIEPATPTTMYIGTDIGVFFTTNGGTTWAQMSQGLPNCAVFDLKLHAPSRLLRAATHGRGLWERRLDLPSMPNVDLFVRDHLMHTGRVSPTPNGVPAAFEDPLHYVTLNAPLYMWMCADIKVDALEGAVPSYQMPVASVDVVKFESELQHRNAQRGRVNRVYVQVHNRGIQDATNVTVKILYANASPGLPPLPSDFWTAWPANSSLSSPWTPVGPAKTIPVLSASTPTVLEWDWNTPTGTADHTCMLVVVNSAEDPIPAAHKVFDIGTLISTEKRVGLKNLHIVDAVPGTGFWTMLDLYAVAGSPIHLNLKGLTSNWSAGILLPKTVSIQENEKLRGIKPVRLTSDMTSALKHKLGELFEQYDTSRVHLVDSLDIGGRLEGLRLPKGGARVMIWLNPPQRASDYSRLDVVQEDKNGVVGGNTFILRTVKK